MYRSLSIGMDTATYYYYYAYSRSTLRVCIILVLASNIDTSSYSRSMNTVMTNSGALFLFCSFYTPGSGSMFLVLVSLPPPTSHSFLNQTLGECRQPATPSRK